MAESLAMRQQADGFWRPNLDDPEQHKDWESSGTGFFSYGIAWGINNGILDRERFLPVARKGWAALALGCQRRRQGRMESTSRRWSRQSCGSRHLEIWYRDLPSSR